MDYCRKQWVTPIEQNELYGKLKLQKYPEIEIVKVFNEIATLGYIKIVVQFGVVKTMCGI